MSFRSQTSHKSGNRPRTTHDKKSREKRQRKGAKYLQEETPQATSQEVVERALSGINRLGTQIFALSPFSQYFDDWLINLRQIVSEFESNPAVNVDEQFQKECAQIFLDVEGALAQNRIDESNLTAEARALADNNHKIVEADKEYAEKTRELSTRRNMEIQRLTNNVNQLEDYLAAQQEVKISFFKFGEKKRTAEKLVQTEKDLLAAKNELEVNVQNFAADQDKLHDSYEKQKQELSAESDRLHKELEKLETDTSATTRLTACNALSEAIKSLSKRIPL
jgi:DNA repair exonuclease SbcCD ATPase subunit